MLVETITQPQAPIKMVFCQAPGAETEAQEIYRRGLATWGVNVLEHPIPQISIDDTQIDLETAKRHSFGFVEMYGRKGGNSTVVACMSNWLVGFDTTDPGRQAQAGLDILRRIVPPDDAQDKKYGEHKYVVFLETDLDSETLLRRVLDAQTELIPKHFPRFRDAQEELSVIRQAQLLDLEDRKPFVEIFEGEVSTLKRPWQDNDNEYYEWGYEEEDGDLFGINPDNKKQSLASLSAGSPLEETKDMLTDINNFLKGAHGRNRFVVQIDFGEDAACSNVAINAQQNITLEKISGIETTNLFLGSKFKVLPLTYFASGGGGSYTKESSDYCQKCKKSKKDNGCNCNF